MGYAIALPISFSGEPLHRRSTTNRVRFWKAVTGQQRCAYRHTSTSVRCAGGELRTCKNCKAQYDPLLNHPRACRYHTADFGGETKRKFESVYAGGTMNTPDSGQVFQYWHCCGSEDPFDAGCTAAPHCSYDD